MFDGMKVFLLSDMSWIHSLCAPSFEFAEILIFCELFY